MRNHWTREGIIRHLLEREAQGLPLTVGGRGVDRLTYAAAQRIFGSWRNAVHAAGIPRDRALSWERWSPAKILLIIRHLAQRDRHLSAAQMERRYGNMMAAARRHFGSWTKAVLAAGVDPTRLQRVIPWTQERVVEAILTRALRNESLVSQQVEPRSLVDAGRRFFGTWAAAVTAAGLGPTMITSPAAVPKRRRAARAPASSPNAVHKPGQPWTKDLIIAAIQQRLSQGRPMNARSLAREDRGLYRAARRHLKNWSNALRTAGLDPADYRLSRLGKPQLDAPGVHEQIGPKSQENEGLRPAHPA